MAFRASSFVGGLAHSMSRNEAQTRFDLIDPALETRGWLRSDIRIEVTAAQIDIVDGKPRRRPSGRTDYLLRRPLVDGGELTPLAIIEASYHFARRKTTDLRRSDG